MSEVIDLCSSDDDENTSKTNNNKKRPRLNNVIDVDNISDDSNTKSYSNNNYPMSSSQQSIKYDEDLARELQGKLNM